VILESSIRVFVINEIDCAMFLVMGD